jgi:hypothetical protein
MVGVQQQAQTTAAGRRSATGLLMDVKRRNGNRVYQVSLDIHQACPESPDLLVSWEYPVHQVYPEFQ